MFSNPNSTTTGARRHHENHLSLFMKERVVQRDEKMQMELDLRRQAAAQSESEWRIEPLLDTALPPRIISPSLCSVSFSSAGCQRKSLSFLSLLSGSSVSLPYLHLLDSSALLSLSNTFSINCMHYQFSSCLRLDPSFLSLFSSSCCISLNQHKPPSLILFHTFLTFINFFFPSTDSYFPSFTLHYLCVFFCCFCLMEINLSDWKKKKGIDNVTLGSFALGYILDQAESCSSKRYLFLAVIVWASVPGNFSEISESYVTFRGNVLPPGLC